MKKILRPHYLRVRLSRKELRHIRRSAAEHGLSLSSFFRFRLLARQQLATETELTPRVSPRREEVGA